MAHTGQTFRVFVSSTFADLKAERDALQREVFPRLRELCARQGTRFQAVDLRWGVGEETIRDQRALATGLAEVRRCQRISPRPNFLVLLGNRYGVRLLPTTIPSAEIEAILQYVPAAQAKRLQSWYTRDDNAVPAEHKLKWPDGVFADSKVWVQEEQTLRAALLLGLSRMPAGRYDPVRFVASVTEQEILQGALSNVDAPEHVHCYFREIVNLDEMLDDIAHRATVADFVDVDAEGLADGEAERRVEDLKDRLREHLPGNIHEYQARWTGSGLTTDHLAALCDDVYAHLSALIQQEIKRYRALPAVDQEADAHAAFARERTRHFFGRGEALQALEAYLLAGGPHPAILYGAPGAGKSAVIAHAARTAGEARPGAVVVTRYVGATPGSSDMPTLLERLCRDISRAYAADETTIPTDLEGLAREFAQRLSLARPGAPLIVLLDGLDQLGDDGHAPALGWLPAELPEHVRLVASLADTPAGRGYAPLRARLHEATFVELGPMPVEEAAALLDRWLADAGRTLQEHQREEVLGKFQAQGLPLYLELAFQEARRWRSDTPEEETTLEKDVVGIVRQLLDRLAQPEQHGPVLPERTLGCLAAAKDGLAEDELLDVLSADAAVLADVRGRLPGAPEVDRLPAALWARLHADLEPYLVERSGDGAALLSFRSAEVAAAVAQRFASGERGVERHRALARYFAQAAQAVDGEETVPNLRWLAELPYQQTMGRLWDELYATLTDFSFLERKAATGPLERRDAHGNVTHTYAGIYLLQDDFDRALAHMLERRV
jgi:hypothetical protein